MQVKIANLISLSPQQASHVHETLAMHICEKMRAPGELDPKTSLKSKGIVTTISTERLHLRRSYFADSTLDTVSGSR